MIGKGKILNVEVGDRLTKVCLSVPKGNSIQIKTSFLFDTPADAVSDGVISNPQELGRVLKEQLHEHKLSAESKNVVFALTSGKVASREVMLPPVKDNRLKSVVEANATDYFPIDMSKYHISYNLIERITTSDNPGCRTLVMAVPLSVLEGYFTLASEAGLNILAIDYSGNSQYQALRDVSAEGVTMYVNVDCNSSLVTFMNGNRFIMQRSFAFGGDEFILNYMNVAGKTDYIAALKECSSDNPQFMRDGTMTRDAVDDNLSRLVSSIVRSIDYFNSNNWETPAEHVVLMGPCSHLIGLQRLVASSTGLDTEFLDNSPSISALTNAASSASCFISCIGSNLAPLDLIPPQFKVDKKKSKSESQKNDSLVSSIVICGVCVLAAAVLSVVSIMSYNNALLEKKTMENKIAELSYTRDVANTYVTFVNAADTLTTFGASIDSPNDALTPFFEELEKKMPSEILLLSAMCERSGVTMNVTVPTFEDAAVVLVKLRSFESISDISLSAIAEETDETQGTYVIFSLQCSYGTNFYLHSEEETVEVTAEEVTGNVNQ